MVVSFLIPPPVINCYCVYACTTSGRVRPGHPWRTRLLCCQLDSLNLRWQNVILHPMFSKNGGGGGGEGVREAWDLESEVHTLGSTNKCLFHSLFLIPPPVINCYCVYACTTSWRVRPEHPWRTRLLCCQLDSLNLSNEANF